MMCVLMFFIVMLMWYLFSVSGWYSGMSCEVVLVFIMLVRLVMVSIVFLGVM